MLLFSFLRTRKDDSFFVQSRVNLFQYKEVCKPHWLMCYVSIHIRQSKTSVCCVNKLNHGRGWTHNNFTNQAWVRDWTSIMTWTKPQQNHYNTITCLLAPSCWVRLTMYASILARDQLFQPYHHLWCVFHLQITDILKRTHCQTHQSTFFNPHDTAKFLIRDSVWETKQTARYKV